MRTSFARIALASAIASLTLPGVASAASEVGDAGELPATAQDLTGAPFALVDGTLATGHDADVYRVCLQGDGSFSATTVGGSSVDTQLFLHEAGGRGVYANDDAPPTRQSTLPAGHPLTPASAGVYLLAISAYDRDPASMGEIFADAGRVVGPTGPGGIGPLVSWTGSPGQAGAYSIALTGTAECAPPDTTPPTIDLREPADGASVPRGAEVLVDFSCDDQGGSGLASCEGSLADGAALDTATLGPRPVTVRARDGAGNETVVTHTATVVDRTAPTIAIDSPLEGAVYLLGEEVASDYDCADEDGGSGLILCAGDVADGEPIDTAAVGERSFTVSARDAAGNTASAAVGYRVVFDFRGFRRPVRDLPGVNRGHAGAVVPVRFRLRGHEGSDVLADRYPQVAQYGCASEQRPSEGEPARLLGRVRYRRWRRHHRFLWKTEREWAGSCRRLLLGLSDGSVHAADFRFRG